jgi:acetylornithine deacetylase/succinyl-diaminopimelate desuccinylase-like protein
MAPPVPYRQAVQSHTVPSGTRHPPAVDDHPVTPQSAARQHAPAIDWEGALWSCIAHLQALIRMDTVNPPGQEISVARYLDDVLRGAGIETTLVEPDHGRAAVIARLRGTGGARPVLLLAHMDVVGVERDKWTTKPFGAEILDGFVYGRGAIDDKGMLATNLQAMLLLNEYVVRAGGSLDRDVVFVATSDEEAGGKFGIDWVLSHHGDLLDAEFALNEGGRIRQAGGRVAYAAIQCGEKIPCVLEMTATGSPGHASIPTPGNAVVHLARAVAIAGEHAEPVVVTEVVRDYFAGLSAFWPDASPAQAMADVASGDEERVERGAVILRAHPRFDAVLRNGIAPTMLSAGVRANVIPGTASATLNVRLIPGQSLDDLVGRLRAAIDDTAVDITVLGRGAEAPATPTGTPMYRAIVDAVASLAPGVPSVPFLSTGATDSASLRRAGVHAYGLLPFPLTESDEARMHGHDERVAVQSLEFAVRLTWDILHRVAVPA